MGPLRTFAIPQLFIDQDGVLANLDAHYLHHFGKTADHPGAFSPEEFWGSVNSVDKFWRTIPPFEHTRSFWLALAEMHPNPTILTSIAKVAPDHVEQEKREWVDEHLFPSVTVLTCRAKDKRLFCQDGDILVDDWEKHRKPWESVGGRFVLHKGDYMATLSHVKQLLDVSKRYADQRTVFLSHDGTMMCERHPGFVWGDCPAGASCQGPGVPWKLSGRTEIQNALTLARQELLK